MKVRAIYWIIGLMTLSALGLIGLQGYWLRYIWQAKEEQFDRSVHDALNRVVTQLETREVAAVMKQHIAVGNAEQETETVTWETEKSSGIATKKTTAKKSKKVRKNLVAKNTEKVSHEFVPGTFTTRIPDHASLQVFKIVPVEVGSGPFNFTADSLLFRSFNNPEITQRIIDSLMRPVRILSPDSIYRRIKPKEHTQIVIRNNKAGDSLRKILFHSSLVSDSIRNSRRFQQERNRPVVIDRHFFKQEPQPELPEPKEIITLERQKEIVTRKQEQVGEVMQKMVVELVKKELPISKRLDSKAVDSLVAAALNDKGINLPYSLKVAEKASFTDSFFRTPTSVIRTI